VGALEPVCFKRRMADDWRQCVLDPALRVLAELNLTVNDRNSISPLSRAVLLGAPAAELKKYRQYMDKLDDRGRTALRYAVEMGSLETTKELVDSLNANVDVADAEGVSPVHVAARRGDIEILDVLLKKAAQVVVPDKHGETPLVAACRLMNWEVVPRLAKHGLGNADAAGMTPLHWVMTKTSSISDCSEAVEALLSSNADVNAQNLDGCTPLHLAAKRGLSDACQLLVKRGAKLNIPDKKGEIPLHKSISQPTILQGKNCALQVLIDMKSDVTARRLDGKTADDIIANALSTRTWTDAQKIAFEVARRRLAKATEDMHKV